MGILWKTLKSAHPMGFFLSSADCGYFLGYPLRFSCRGIFHRFFLHSPQEYVEKKRIFISCMRGRFSYINTYLCTGCADNSSGSADVGGQCFDDRLHICGGLEIVLDFVDGVQDGGVVA